MKQKVNLSYRLYRLKTILTTWLPALMIVAAIAGIAIFIFTKPAKELPETTDSLMSDTGPKKDPMDSWTAGAKETLPPVPPDDHEETFAKALEFAKTSGTRKQASELMHRLAPTQGAVTNGYAAAHLWVAEQIFRPVEAADGSMATPSLAPGEMEAVGEHLRRSIELDPKVAKAHNYLMSYYLRRGEQDRAVAALESGAVHFPEMGLTLASLLKQGGSLEQANERAQALVLKFRELALSHPEEPSHRLRWAQGEMVQDHFESVLAIAERGQALHKGEEGYRALRRAAYLALVDRALKAKPLDLEAVFKQVDLLVDFDPDHPLVVTMIGTLCSLPETKVRAIPILAAMRKSVRTPALTHRLLGDLEAKAGRLSKAMTLYEEAIAKEPNQATAKNNLAWCLTEIEPPQLDKALILVDEAITDLGNQMNPHFYETRGQILLQSERFDEAVTSLEQALRFMPEASKVKVHRSLAVAYNKLGMTDLAETHGRLAAEREATTQE